MKLLDYCTKIQIIPRKRNLQDNVKLRTLKLELVTTEQWKLRTMNQRKRRQEKVQEKKKEKGRQNRNGKFWKKNKRIIFNPARTRGNRERKLL